MRNQKLSTIFNYICHRGTGSRDQLARAVDMSSASISNFVTTLLRADLIRVQGERPSRGGRRAVIFEVNGPARYLVGADLQGDCVKFGLCDLAGRATKVSSSVEGIAPRLAFTDFQGALRRYVAALPSEELDRVIGVGVSIPGLLDRKAEGIIASTRTPWINVPVKEILERDLGRPVFLARSIQADLLAEKWFGLARGARNCLFISSGLGIGCGLLLDGRLYTGTALMGGEFGHVTAVRDGLRCSCGRQGCLEMYVSDEAILRAYHEIERPGRGQASTIQEVAERAHAGEAAAREAFLVACRHLAREIVDLVQLLNPELIIIGGTLGEHADLCLPEIERFVREQAMPELSGFVHLVPSSLGADIGIKGAAAQALHQLIHSSEGMDRLLRPVPKPARRGSRAVAAP